MASPKKIPGAKEIIAVPQDMYKDVIQSMVWMSYRYCIGRHSIGACMHAPELAQFINLNPRAARDKQFMAKDIRGSISDVMRWRDDVHVDGFPERVDAYSLILREIVDKKLDFEHKLYKYNVDFYTNTVSTEERRLTDETAQRLSYLDSIIGQNISDLMPWIKLANWLDPQLMISYHDPELDEDFTKPGFEFFTNWGGQVHRKFATQETYMKNPFVDWYISPEFIIEITNI
jgi:hypothetical protein